METCWHGYDTPTHGKFEIHNSMHVQHASTLLQIQGKSSAWIVLHLYSGFFIKAMYFNVQWCLSFTHWCHFPFHPLYDWLSAPMRFRWRWWKLWVLCMFVHQDIMQKVPKLQNLQMKGKRKKIVPVKILQLVLQCTALLIYSLAITISSSRNLWNYATTTTC